MVQTVTDNHAVVSDVIAWELEGNHRPSRNNETVAASQSLVNGQVVAKNGSGQIIAYTVAATAAAVGIFVGEAIVTGAGQTAKCVIVARDARFADEKLVYASGVTNGEKTNALTALAALSILPVRSV